MAGDLAHLERCLASGMLHAIDDAVAALADPPRGRPDLARLAHHAEAAGDADAVLSYAPDAAERAAVLGAPGCWSGAPTSAI